MNDTSQWTMWGWAAMGCIAGCLHVALLSRATQRRISWAPAWGLLRIVIVALFLAAAARSGAILSAAAGWGGGFGVLLGGYLAAAPQPKRKPPEDAERENRKLPPCT